MDGPRFFFSSADSRTLAWSTRLWQGSEGHLFTVDVERRKVKSHYTDDVRSTITGVQTSADGRRVLATLLLVAAWTGMVAGHWCSGEDAGIWFRGKGGS
ncbi:MAG: hypothetical protein HC937_03105 [Aquincola sp.]|nr:hypothetical protein [Aquincola sp.]